MSGDPSCEVPPRQQDPNEMTSTLDHPILANAAPIVLDLALFLDLAARAGQSGVQEWLSFYWKDPQPAGDSPPEHDVFIQQTKLKNTLREWMGEAPVTHSEAG